MPGIACPIAGASAPIQEDGTRLNVASLASLLVLVQTHVHDHHHKVKHDRITAKRLGVIDVLCDVGLPRSSCVGGLAASPRTPSN